MSSSFCIDSWCTHGLQCLPNNGTTQGGDHQHHFYCGCHYGAISIFNKPAEIYQANRKVMVVPSNSWSWSDTYEGQMCTDQVIKLLCILLSLVISSGMPSQRQPRHFTSSIQPRHPQALLVLVGRRSALARNDSGAILCTTCPVWTRFSQIYPLTQRQHWSRFNPWSHFRQLVSN